MSEERSQGPAPGDGDGDRWGLQRGDASGATRRFPTEGEWLDLPTPADLPTGAEDEAFLGRVLRAREDERQLDRELRELDHALPDLVLKRFAAPTPSQTFPERTARRVLEDRRQRWAKTLARYVAPEPTPQFIDRTLAALRDAPATPSPRAPSAPRGGGGGPLLGLLSAAAAAGLWAALIDRSPPPLEARIADQVPASASYVDAPTPMAAVFADIAARAEPHALFDAPVDGLWLYQQRGEQR